jgi:hypothetical protein
MIRCSIKSKGKELVCDFHTHHKEYLDFKSLWIALLLKAKQTRLAKIRIIPGSSPIEGEINSRIEILTKKLSKMPYISSLIPITASELLIALSPRFQSVPSDDIIHHPFLERKDQNMTNSKSDLKKLFKELKSQEEDKVLEQLKEKPKAVMLEQKTCDAIVESVEEKLTDTWDEQWLIQTITDLFEQGKRKEAYAVLDHISVYECFFSENFNEKYDYWMSHSISI